MADDAPAFTIPEADSAHRGEVLSRHRARRAGWLAGLLATVPAEHMPDALAAVLEMERTETEALIELAAAWRATCADVYQQGRQDGARELGETLGWIEAPDTTTMRH